MDYRDFSEQLFPLLGLVPKRLQRRSVRRRMVRHMETLGIREFSRYTERLLQDPKEQAFLRTILTVTISRFFRDRPVYDLLFEAFLPEYLATSPRLEIRVWSAGCGCGEEPYSVAIFACENFDLEEIGFSITGTDINPECLQRAKEGIYLSGTLKEVPAELRDKYFTPRGHQFEVKPATKALVQFEQADIATSSFPEPFDLVLCRNSIFTYHLQSVQLKVMANLYRLLAAGGLLVIGRKEELPPCTEELFKPVSPSLKIFRRE